MLQTFMQVVDNGRLFQLVWYIEYDGKKNNNNKKRVRHAAASPSITSTLLQLIQLHENY